MGRFINYIILTLLAHILITRMALGSSDAFDEINNNMLDGEPIMNTTSPVVWKFERFHPNISQNWQIYSGRLAFAMWSQYSKFHFIYAFDHLNLKRPEVIISFENFTSAKENLGNDSSWENVAGHRRELESNNFVRVRFQAENETQLGGGSCWCISLDSSIQWHLPGYSQQRGNGNGRSIDLVTGIAHGVGHVLGIRKHSDHPDDLMSAQYSKPHRSVSTKDIIEFENIHCRGQYEELKDDVRKKRNAIRDESRLWPNATVHYVISPEYLWYQRRTILNAMRAIETSSCVRFIPRGNQSEYLSIAKGKGCWSFVGRKHSGSGEGGPQSLSLASGCLLHGVVLHELLHALGFFHEQSRNDREEFVKINKENIMPCQFHNFALLPDHVVNTLGTPYDYGSIMHFSPYSFSKYGRRSATLVPTKNNSQVYIGQRRNLSYWDKWKLNKLYCD